MKERVLKVFILISCLVIIPFNFALAQSINPQVIAGGGEHYIGSNAQLSRTLGEAIISTVTGSTSIITQGFHQPSSTNVSIKTWRKDGWGLGVYPNPSSGQFTVQLNAVRTMNLNIINSIGQLVHVQEIVKGQNHIELKTLSTGMYLMNVYDSAGEFFGSYKLQIM